MLWDPTKKFSKCCFIDPKVLEIKILKNPPYSLSVLQLDTRLDTTGFECSKKIFWKFHVEISGDRA